uniref:Remodeling and spacing factor 1 isoform X1 n=1 Tax=Petromyzon marinus TaxID=7757 RepID=A0AAJ7U3J7_PETMA|nr:remodeling and spacing factor 1 isoform X1 [Petromyzon marinus]
MASVASSPNFAVVCSFLERYAALLRLPDFNFAELEAALDDTDEAPNALVELHLRLLKTMGQKVARDRWEKHLAKMCEDFDSPLAWELKNLGYPKMSQANKLILLKFLCETQFDDNVRFKATVNEEEAELMRVQPLGRDRHGLVYWIHTDGHFNTRLYTEEQDDLEQSSWKLLSRNREGLAEVLQGLKLAVSGGAAGQEQNSPSCSSSDTEEPTKLPPPYTTAFKLGQKMKENKAETGDSGGKKLEEGEDEEEEVAPSKKERSEVGETKGGGASGSPEEAEDEEDSSLMKEAVIKLERLDDTMLEKLSQDTCKEETQAKLPVKKRELRMPTEISPDARPSKSDVDGEAQASGADAGGEGKGVASEGGGSGSGGGGGGAQGTAEGEAENGQNGELGRNGGGSGGGGSGGDDVSKGGSVAHKSDAEKDGEDTAAAPTTRKRGTSATHADRVKDAEKGDSEAVAGDPSKVNGQGSPRRITRQRKAASEEAKKAEEKSSSEEKGSSGESEGNDDGGEESQEEPSEGANIDDSCKRCGLSSHPELILLCDGCDDGYHTACLRPPLMLIPDGDWFCPSCQHKKLCEKMEEELNHLDRMVKKSNRAQRRKEMLTYVGISSENILPRKASFNSVQDDEDEEPVGRQRLERRSSRARKAVSYEYKEFDDAIITAIEEDIKEVKEAKRRMAMEQEAEDSGKEEEDEEEGGTGGASAAAAGAAAPASGPVHRGKDISTILRASGRHSGESDDGATAVAEKPKKRAADKSSDDKDEDSDEDDGRRGMARGRGRKRAPAKRKARRLTALDSFDEESEDEDYQESGTEVEEPDNWVDEYGSGDASSGSDYWQSLSRRPRKPRTEPTRRSQRLRGRPMEEDSDLESSDSEVARAARRAGRNKRSERRTAPARRGTRGNRAMARRKGGRNDSDASESDASHKSSPVVARRARATATPRKRQTRSSESHESASSASERPVRKRRRAAPAARARSSDEEEEEEEDEEKAGQRAKPAGSRQRRASGAGGSAQRRQKRPSSARAPVRTPKRKRAARSGRTTTGGAGAGSSSEEHGEHKEGSGGGGGESGEDADEAAIAAGKAQRARDARPRRPRRAAAARGTKAAAAAACDSSGEDEGAPPPPARASRRAGATKEGGGGGDDDEDVADDLLGVEDLVDYVTGE